MDLDLTAIVAIWMGAAVLMVPLLGISARLGLVPLLDAVARMRRTRSSADIDEETERRFARLEARLAHACEQIAELSGPERPRPHRPRPAGRSG